MSSIDQSTVIFLFPLEFTSWLMHHWMLHGQRYTQSYWELIHVCKLSCTSTCESYNTGWILTLLHICFIKAEWLRHNFKELINEYGEGEFPIKEMVEKLMTNTIKEEEECMLPGIHPPEWERPLSSIFVDTQLPLVTS